MAISFDRPLGLLLIPLLAMVFVIWYKGHNALGSWRRVVSLIVRLILLTLLILAISELGWQHTVDRRAVVFVADLSESTRNARPQLEQWIADAIQNKGRDDLAGLVAVGRYATVERAPSPNPQFERFESLVDADHTDLASGLRLAAAIMPEQARKRVILLTDGRQNLGDAIQQAAMLRARGVELDVIPLLVPNGPEALIEEVDVPNAMREGEHFDLHLKVNSTVEEEAKVRLFIDGSPVYEETVRLTGGREDLVLGLVSPSAGFHTIKAQLEPREDTLSQNNEGSAFFYTKGPPKVLLLERNDGASGNMAKALRAAGIVAEVTGPSDFPTALEDLSGFGSVLLVDIDAHSLGDRQMEILQAYVRDLGRGLVVVGGEESFGLGGYRDTTLEEILPVWSDARAKKEKGSMALALVIDKSGSMAADWYGEGIAKIAMAREAASLSIEEISPDDLIGVLAFDSTSSWVVPVQRLKDAGGIASVQKGIGSIDAEGGTEIYLALAKAADAVDKVEAKWKHIILLTDGRSASGGNYSWLTDQMRDQQITLSTIAVGRDADTQLLQELASGGGGRYYFTERARDIPKIMTRETKLATRSAIVEESFVPLLSQANPLLSAVAAKGLPELAGYVVTTAKDNAVVLVTSPKGDPVLAQWHYGLGRVMVWTSDTEGRWSADWVRWPNFGAWWGSLVSWTLPPEEGRFRVDTTEIANTGLLTVETEDIGTASLSAGVVFSAHIVAPDLSTSVIPMEATAPGRYQTSFPTSQLGAYLIQVTQGDGDQTNSSVSTGLVVPYSPEFRYTVPDPDFLQQLATRGGGRLLEEGSEAFRDDLPPASGRVPLQFWLLSASAILLPIDIAVRRLTFSWRDIAGWMRSGLRVLTKRPASLSQESGATLIQLRKRKLNARRRTGDHGEKTKIRPHTSPGAEPLSAANVISATGEFPADPQSLRPDDDRQEQHIVRGREDTQGSEDLYTHRWLEAKKRARRK